MRDHHYLKTATLFVFVILALAIACNDSSTSDAGKRESQGGIPLGGILSVNESEKPESIHPVNIDGVPVSHIAAQVYDGLFKYTSESLELAFNLIESADMDDSETVYTFHIREGVYFHADACFEDGAREVTANDVKYSFELLCQPNGNYKAFERSFKGKVKGVEEFHSGAANEVSGFKVTDKYTIEIHLTKPNKSFPYILVSPITPIVPKEAIEKYGEDAHVGSGPFIYFDEDNKIVLRRNKKYHLEDEFGNHLPYLDQVNVSFIPTKEEEVKAFLNRKLDAVTRVKAEEEPFAELIENHAADFEGGNAKFVKRPFEGSTVKEYTLLRKNVFGFKDNFMNYRDYTSVSMKPDYSEFVE